MGAIIIREKKPDLQLAKEIALNNIELKGKAEVLRVIEDEDYFMFMKALRNDSNRGWSKQRTLRHIASIPGPLYERAIRIWGPDVIKDDKLFKEAFVKDELGSWTLTVPKNTI